MRALVQHHDLKLLFHSIYSLFIFALCKNAMAFKILLCNIMLWPPDQTCSASVDVLGCLGIYSDQVSTVKVRKTSPGDSPKAYILCKMTVW